MAVGVSVGVGVGLGVSVGAGVRVAVGSSVAVGSLLAVGWLVSVGKIDPGCDASGVEMVAPGRLHAPRTRINKKLARGNMRCLNMENQSFLLDVVNGDFSQ